MRPPDDPEVAAWLTKANEDLRAATVLLEHAPSLDAVICFHCQQTAEKALKALFVALNHPPPRTHDLDRLVALLIPDLPVLDRVRDAATFLKAFAVLPRYPAFHALSGRDEGESVTRRAHNMATEIERTVRDLLAQ